MFITRDSNVASSKLPLNFVEGSVDLLSTCFLTLRVHFGCLIGTVATVTKRLKTLDHSKSTPFLVTLYKYVCIWVCSKWVKPVSVCYFDLGVSQLILVHTISRFCRRKVGRGKRGKRITASHFAITR